MNTRRGLFGWLGALLVATRAARSAPSCEWRQYNVGRIIEENEFLDGMSERVAQDVVELLAQSNEIYDDILFHEDGTSEPFTFTKGSTIHVRLPSDFKIIDRNILT